MSNLNLEDKHIKLLYITKDDSNGVDPPLSNVEIINKQ